MKFQLLSILFLLITIEASAQSSAPKAAKLLPPEQASSAVILSPKSLAGTTYGKGLPSFSYPLSKASLTSYDGGKVKQAGNYNFPVSKNIAGVYMDLQPGAIRELHWHADAAEWAYMIEGKTRITLTNPWGQVQIAEVEAGGIWFFPKGWGHSIEALDQKGAKFILVFNNGKFTEQSSFQLSDWISTAPIDMLTQYFGSEQLVKQMPKKEVYISRYNPNGGPLKTAYSLNPNAPAIPVSHIFNLLGQKPVTEGKGGSLKLATNKEFPASFDMSGGVMTLEPGGLRGFHWHPNADEWQFVLKGEMELTVFASGGKASVSKLNQGDIGYVPLGYGHALKNPSTVTPAEILIVFNAGDYQSMDLDQWISTNPVSTLSKSLQMPVETVEKLLPKKKEIFVGPR